MKRFLLPFALLTLVLSPGCKSPSGNNNGANQNGNANSNQSGNINQFIIGNSNANNTSPPAADPKNKSIAIAISASDTGPQVSLAPTRIKLYKSKNHRLRFSIYDNLDQNLDRVEVTFDTSNPFESAFNFTNIGTGTQSDTKWLRIRDDAAEGTYKFKVSIYVAGNPTPIVLDPEVDIAN